MNSALERRIIAALLISVGIILALFEFYIPRPLPWVKPGLANAATLLALYVLGARVALLVSTVRVFVAHLLFGGFAGPAFMMSFGAAFVSTIAMIVAVRFGRRVVGPIGVSLVGAFAHVLTQLTLAGIFLVGHNSSQTKLQNYIQMLYQNSPCQPLS